jgi:RNA polymerase sigma-70 factor (ECF subfamily)
MIAMADDADTDVLIERAARAEGAARDELFRRYRHRLKQMVTVRIDRRLAARLDPSDVVQDVFAEATRHLSEYLRDRPLPFYPWLRRLAWERLVDLHRRHVQARRRSLAREELHIGGVSDESLQLLANRLAGSGTSPSNRAVREELRQRVQRALVHLDDNDREVLLLRYFEQLSTQETASVLGLSDSGVKSRLMRALVRLRELVDEPEARP